MCYNVGEIEEALSTAGIYLYNSKCGALHIATIFAGRKRFLHGDSAKF